MSKCSSATAYCSRYDKKEDDLSISCRRNFTEEQRRVKKSGKERKRTWIFVKTTRNPKNRGHAFSCSSAICPKQTLQPIRVQLSWVTQSGCVIQCLDVICARSHALPKCWHQILTSFKSRPTFLIKRNRFHSFPPDLDNSGANYSAKSDLRFPRSRKLIQSRSLSLGRICRENKTLTGQHDSSRPRDIQMKSTWCSLNVTNISHARSTCCNF